MEGRGHVGKRDGLEGGYLGEEVQREYRKEKIRDSVFNC